MPVYDNYTKDPKICKSCKFYHQMSNGYDILDTCIKPETIMVDVVTGKHVYKQCVAQRDNPSTCGKDAKWYESAPPKPIVITKYEKKRKRFWLF